MIKICRDYSATKSFLIMILEKYGNGICNGIYWYNKETYQEIINKLYNKDKLTNSERDILHVLFVEYIRE